MQTGGLFGKFIQLLLLVVSSTSYASRARVAALQTNHLADTELSYILPTKALEIADYLLIESGSTSALKGEKRTFGAVHRSLNEDTAILFTFGRDSDLVQGARDVANTYLVGSFYPEAQNSLNLNYTTRFMGASYSLGFYYSHFKDRVTPLENSASTLNLGFRISDLSLGLFAGLANTTDDGLGKRLSISSSFVTHLAYEMDNLQFILKLGSNKIQQESGATLMDSLRYLTYSMGMASNAINGKDIYFYRFDLATTQVDDLIVDGIIEKTITLPLTIGVESDLNDFIKIRTSVKQTIGVYQSEQYSSGPNSTTAAAGLGVKMSPRLSLDGVLQGLVGSTANQKIDSNHLFSQVSLTYLY